MSIVDDEIAHYTTEKGLEGILGSKTLWATHWRFLNDYSEMQHGMRIINSIFDDALKLIPQEDPLRRLIEQEGPEFLQTLWLRGISPNSGDPELFVTSFSRMPDENKDDGILSQWRSYGDSGGFAIVFSQAGLKNSYGSFSRKCKNHAEIMQNCLECQKNIFAHLLLPVTYQKDIVRLEKIGYKEALEIIRECALEIIRSAEYGLNNIDLEKIDNFVKAIVALLTTIKHPGFHEEREFRFACLNRLECPGGGYHFESPYEVVKRNNVPRLEISFSPDTIKRIIIGPQPNQDQKVVIVRHYLALYGYKNIEVLKSSIPYRQMVGDK